MPGFSAPTTSQTAYSGQCLSAPTTNKRTNKQTNKQTTNPMNQQTNKQCIPANFGMPALFRNVYGLQGELLLFFCIFFLTKPTRLMARESFVASGKNGCCVLHSLFSNSFVITPQQAFSMNGI